MIVLPDKKPQIEDQQRYALALEKMRALFKTAAMLDAANFAAVVHERAADYIIQAPVLALVVKTVAGKHKLCDGDQLYAAAKFWRLCEDGARLKDVMAAYGLPLPLRKLKAKALALNDEYTVRQIARMLPSTISQIIPGSIVAQRRWLSAFSYWRVLTRHSKMHERATACWEWAAVQIAKHGVRFAEVQTVADFAMRSDQKLNTNWEWPRACVAAEEWHERLAAPKAKAAFGALADQIIDHGPHPDHHVIDGIEFIALRTPMAIHAEGQAMKHCVASYVTDVLNGRCSIVAVRTDELRLATMELRGTVIAQLKGRFNATPHETVRRAARAYVMFLEKRASRAALDEAA